MIDDPGPREEIFIPLPPPAEPIAAAVEPLPRYRVWKLGAAFLVVAVTVAAGLIFGDEWGHFASSAWHVVPLAVLALLAYLGARHWWAMLLTLIATAVIVFGVGAGLAVLTFLVAFELPALGESDSESYRHVAPAGIKLGIVSVAIIGSILVSLAGFLPAVRRVLAPFLPLDPRSFVHAVALVTVTALTLMTLMPLLVLAAPPLLSMVVILQAQGEDITDGRGPAGLLLDELYSLVWLVPAAFFAVAYGLRRTFPQALERLGLARPTWRQVMASLGIAIVLVLVVGLSSPWLDRLWDFMGWPKTDMKSFEHLMAHFFTPLGALVIGIVAGLGEELAVRGVLQPRLGIWFSNAFFTSLHALQYNWDVLLVVFLLGLIFGLIRRQTNTTTSALTHGLYDFLLIMAVSFEIPGFED